MTANSPLADQFGKVVELTQERINQRIEKEIGFTDDPKLTQIIKEKNINASVKKILRDFVIPQLNLRDCIKELKKIISSSPLYNRDLDWSTNDLAHNIYHHYDAAYNKFLAQEFDMKFFIFQGGIIEDSRDFCVAHNNKTWSIEEAKTWQNWTPSLGKYPDNYRIKSTSLEKVPNYLRYPGYDPLIDIGGYGCRHMLGFITDYLAFEQRQDLRKE